MTPDPEKQNAPAKAPDAPEAAKSKPKAARKAEADSTAKETISGEKSEKFDTSSLPKKSREIYESVDGVLDSLEMDSEVKDSLKGALAYILKYLPGLFGGLSPKSFFNDLDKDDSEYKDVKLSDKDEKKLKDSWINRSPQITSAFIESLQKFENSKAATMYACPYLGGITADEPGALAQALRSSKMGDGLRYKQIQNLSELKSPVKKGTVIFVSFKPLTGEVIPCVATGNGGEFKLLYPDPEDKSENPNKVERSIYVSGTGEPKIPGGLGFKGALIPLYVTDLSPFTDPNFKGDIEVDVNDDTPVGIVLTAKQQSDEYVEQIERYIASSQNRAPKHQATWLNKALDSLDKLQEVADRSMKSLDQIERINPELHQKLSSKFVDVGKLYAKELDAIRDAHKLIVVPLDKNIESKKAALKVLKAQLEEKLRIDLNDTSIKGINTLNSEIASIVQQKATFSAIIDRITRHYGAGKSLAFKATIEKLSVPADKKPQTKEA